MQELFSEASTSLRWISPLPPGHSGIAWEEFFDHPRDVKASDLRPLPGTPGEVTFSQNRNQLQSLRACDSGFDTPAILHNHVAVGVGEEQAAFDYSFADDPFPRFAVGFYLWFV